MNHVLHPMLMGLGREGSISIAYLILLSGRDRITLGSCAFGWRSGRVPRRAVQVRLCPAERCTVCTMASLPFPFPIPAHDTVSVWSWIFRRKSSDAPQRRQKRESHRYYTSAVRKDRCARWARGACQDSRTRMCSARRPDTARRPPALIRSSQQPIPLIRSHSRLHFRLHKAQ